MQRTSVNAAGRTDGLALVTRENGKRSGARGGFRDTRVSRCTPQRAQFDLYPLRKVHYHRKRSRIKGSFFARSAVLHEGSSLAFA